MREADLTDAHSPQFVSCDAPHGKPGAFSVPSVYWTLLGAVVWIATRKLERVGDIEFKLLHWRDWLGLPAKEAWLRELNLAVSNDCFCDRSPCSCVDQAIRELIDRLQAGALPAFGINPVRNEIEFLLKEAFAFARVGFSSVDGLRLLRKVRLVTVRRADVRVLWPPRKGDGDPDELVRKPPVVAMAAAVGQCEEWLTGQFSDPANAKMRRTEFKDRAISDVFRGRLSGRGFRNAWNAATEQFPLFRRPGPRLK